MKGEGGEGGGRRRGDGGRRGREASEGGGRRGRKASEGRQEGEGHRRALKKIRRIEKRRTGSYTGI